MKPGDPVWFMDQKVDLPEVVVAVKGDRVLVKIPGTTKKDAMWVNRSSLKPRDPSETQGRIKDITC